MNKMPHENLVRVSKAKGLPVSKATLYRWKHFKKFPNLFVKIGRSLYVDLAALAEIIEAGRLADTGE